MEREYEFYENVKNWDFSYINILEENYSKWDFFETLKNMEKFN